MGRNFAGNFSWSKGASILLADYGQHSRSDRYRLRAFVVALGRYQYEIRFVALTADGSAKPTRDAALPVLTIRLTIRIVKIEKAQ